MKGFAQKESIDFIEILVVKMSSIRVITDFVFKVRYGM